MNRIYILLATYNGTKYLEEQINSILNQTYENWKLIIHDDNSNDNSVSIIKEYSKKYPNKIKLIDDSIATGGAKENFTYLLYHIDDNFDYIMFADQDDVWLKNKIEITLDKMLKIEQKNYNKPILIHTDLKVVDKELDIISESMFKYQKLNISNQYNLERISLENIVTGCTMMINKSLSLKVKYIPKEAIMHDWWFAIITLRDEGIISMVRESTILYRQHELNTIGSQEINLFYYVKKFFNLKKNVKNYIDIYQQYKRANISIKIYKLIFMKFSMILKKF